MKRRGNRDGSIYQRKADGMWVAAVTVPGSRRRKTRIAKTRAAAQLKLQQLRNKVASRVVDESDLTVRQTMGKWLESLDVAPTTKATYLTVSKHIGVLLDVRIQRLSKLMIEDWLAGLKKTAGRRTVQAAAIVLRSVCTFATKFDLIAANPFVSDVPSAKPKDIDVFSVEEVQTILTRFAGHRHEVVAYLAFCCALRRGEIFGLQWQDIDFDGGFLSVRRQVVQHGKDQSKWVREPKTSSSQRTIHIPAIALEALQRRRVLAMKEGTASSTDFVVTTPKTRQMVPPKQFQKRVWRFILADERPKSRKRKNPPPAHVPFPIRHRGIHHARHTCASIMLQNGVPVTEVAAFLGHANPTMTTRRYAHAMPGSGQRAAKSIDQALNCYRVAVSDSNPSRSEAS
jgi:integrase